MNLFDQQVTLSVNSVVLIAAIVAVLLLIAIIIFLIVRNHKQQVAIRPKYGFLGKSLYAMLTVAVLAGGLVIGILSVTNENNVFQVQAKKTMSADIVLNSLLQQNGNTYVDFKVVPMVGGKTWGQQGDNFTIYWTFTGASGETYSYMETNKNSNSPSDLQEYFTSDSYHITVNIVFQDNTYTFTKDSIF
jgi:hypothetical protein